MRKFLFCQFAGTYVFTPAARNETFRKHVKDWQKAGAVAEWKAKVCKVDGQKPGQIEETGDHERFVGVPGMSALPNLLHSQMMLQAGEHSLQIHTECRVAHVQPIKDERIVRLFVR